MREREREKRSDLRVVGALSAGLPSLLLLFQSSVGQLTIITSRVIPKADRLEGGNVTSPRRRVVRGARGGRGGREGRRMEGEREDDGGQRVVMRG